jgi:hypothetical protein
MERSDSQQGVAGRQHMIPGFLVGAHALVQADALDVHSELDSRTGRAFVVTGASKSVAILDGTG